MLAITEEMANIAEAALADARAVAASSTRALRRQGEAASGRANTTLGKLKETRSITRIIARFGRAPRAAAADHGCGEAPVYKELEDLNVKKVVVPKKGKLSQARKKVEPARGSRELVKWRTGSEGRTAALGHRYGWARSLMDGTPGAATWCGWGIFTHNSVNLAHLAATQGTTAPECRRKASPGHAPPGAALPSTPPLAP